MDRPPPFVLELVDEDGLRVVGVHHVETDSLVGAALLGRSFQEVEGWKVTIVDKSENPPKRYSIDERGMPVLLF